MKNTVHLHIPALFSVAEHNTKLDAINILLSRATVMGRVPSFFSGLTEPVPAGALGALAYGLNPGDALWCRADPIECRVDHQRAHMLGNAHFEISPREQAQIMRALNDLLIPDQHLLVPGNSHEWFCKLGQKTNITFPGLHESFFPTGPDQNYWKRLITECQMVLQQQAHAHISSLWFWGIGKLPQNIRTAFTHIYSDDSVTRGLGMCANVPTARLPAIFIPENGHTLVSVHQYKPDYYEQHWFKPLLQALKQGRLDALTISTDNREYFITKKHLYYFWRRIRNHYVNRTPSEN